MARRRPGRYLITPHMYYHYDEKLETAPTLREAKQRAQQIADVSNKSVWISKGVGPDTHEVRPRTGMANPSASLRAQVRRLPTGEVQIKVPLKRGENPNAVASQLKRLLGKRVKNIQVVGGSQRKRKR